MSHEVETMAFANAVPWHGLGKQVSDDLTPKEMMVAAGLDWRVEKRPIYFKSPIVTADDEAFEQDTHVGGKMALVRDSDNRCMDVVGEDWNPVQNEEVFDFFNRYCGEMGAKMETAGSLRGGQMVWGLANMGEGFVLPDGDAVKGYLLMSSHHKSGRSTQIRLTGIRVVCANTYALAMGSATQGAYRQTHMSEFDPEAAQKHLGLYREAIFAGQREAEALVKIKVDRKKTLDVLTRIFQPFGGDEDKRLEAVYRNEDLLSRQVKDVMKSVETGVGATPENAWGVFNGVTHYADHVAGRGNDSRLYSAWNGKMARAKEDAKSLLLELAD